MSTWWSWHYICMGPGNTTQLQLWKEQIIIKIRRVMINACRCNLFLLKDALIFHHNHTDKKSLLLFVSWITTLFARKARTVIVIIIIIKYQLTFIYLLVINKSRVTDSPHYSLPDRTDPMNRQKLITNHTHTLCPPPSVYQRTESLSSWAACSWLFQRLYSRTVKSN